MVSILSSAFAFIRGQSAAMIVTFRRVACGSAQGIKPPPVDSVPDRKHIPAMLAKKLPEKVLAISAAKCYYETKSKKPNNPSLSIPGLDPFWSPGMARPRAKELTERELEVMQVFWKHGQMTAVDARERLAEGGLDRAYTTIATLMRILVEKGFLKQLPGDERPFLFRPTRSQEEVSGRMLADVLDRVFGGSREQLLVQLLKQKKLTAKERSVLLELLTEKGP
jgi:predicted transcriptional regulator